MRQIYRVDAAFGQTGRMDAAWNQENADFRQKSVSYQEEKHMVTAVVGANWGDEGKGKITDMLADEADIVIRFQGGANAGHTIVNNYGKFALHTLPSGVFHSHITNIIGNGVALDIPKVIGELKSITDRNVPAPKLMISDRAQMVMPYHVCSTSTRRSVSARILSVPQSQELHRSIRTSMQRSVSRSASCLMRSF